MFADDQPLLHVLVEDFLDQLRAKTGVGVVFIQSARPAVRQMFETAQADQLEKGKLRFEEMARSHNMAENHLRSTLGHLERLAAEQSTGRMDSETAARLSLTTAVIVNSLIATYGGFGPRPRAYA
mgnify:CR=1 FL=1